MSRILKRCDTVVGHQFFFFLAFGLTTSGSLLFSSTMINSGGFVCLNYRVIHIHSFSLLLLHGLFLLGLGLVHSYS
jgi:hypothetical protein